MFEMIGGLASAGAGIAGALINAEEQEQTRQMNWAIAVMNYQQRERERAEAIAMATKLRKEQQLGTTDIRGTRTKFVPGKGWVTTGAPELLAMMKLQDAEQMKVLQHDLPQRRKVLDRNYVRGLADESTADTYRRQLGNIRMGSDQAIAGDLYNAQAMGLREAGRDAGRRVFTQAMRTGNNSNFASIAAAMQEKTNDAYARAALQSRLASRGLARRDYDEARKGTANLYNLFATRAQQVPEVNYRPQSIDTAGTTESSARNALVAGQDLTKMFAMKGGELDYLSPNLALGNGIAAAGQALGSAFRMGGAQQRDRETRGLAGFGSPNSAGSNSGMYTTTQDYGWTND